MFAPSTVFKWFMIGCSAGKEIFKHSLFYRVFVIRLNLSVDTIIFYFDFLFQAIFK